LLIWFCFGCTCIIFSSIIFQANQFEKLKTNARFLPYSLPQGIRVESHVLKSIPATKSDSAVNVLLVTVI